jgi:hypothetical protein
MQAFFVSWGHSWGQAFVLRVFHGFMGSGLRSSVSGTRELERSRTRSLSVGSGSHAPRTEKRRPDPKTDQDGRKTGKARSAVCFMGSGLRSSVSGTRELERSRTRSLSVGSGSHAPRTEKRRPDPKTETPEKRRPDPKTEKSEGLTPRRPRRSFAAPWSGRRPRLPGAGTKADDQAPHSRRAGAPAAPRGARPLRRVPAATPGLRRRRTGGRRACGTRPGAPAAPRGCRPRRSSPCRGRRSCARCGWWRGGGR